VLADSVTLVVVGVCPEHGTAELSRVRLVVAETVELEPQQFLSHAFDPYPADPVAPAVDRPMVSVAYRAGTTCGLHLGDGRACSRPTGHGEAHAA
jgi:hypothetical protein